VLSFALFWVKLCWLLGREICFVLPVHSLYSNAAANLVAPLGSSFSIPHVDGMIGQVWTGPVRWALANYNSYVKPAEILLRTSGELQVIKSPQTLEQIVENEDLLPKEKLRLAINNHLELLVKYAHNVNVYHNELRFLSAKNRQKYRKISKT